MRLKIIIYCLLFISFSACDPFKGSKTEYTLPEPSIIEEILTKGTLDVSTFYSTTDYYVYKGITRGFHYDLAKDFASFLGVKLQISEINSDTDTAILKLQENCYDLLAFSLTTTPERENTIILSHPLFETGEVLVQNKSNIPIKNLSDLDGRTVFVKKNAPYKKRLQQIEDSLNIRIKISEVGLFSSEDILHLVDIGEIKYAVADENIAKVLSSSMKNLDYSVHLKRNIPISWATNSSARYLNEEINTWIVQIKKNGKLNMTYNRYFNNQNTITHHNSKYALLKKGDISVFDNELKKASKLLNWDWRLLAAIVYQESQFNPEAESPVGAYGLMQVIPETADMFHVYDYFQPDSNIYVGVQYIKYLDNIFSQYDIAPEEKIKFTLASYNVGPGHVMDAMRLTEKYQKDPHKWEGNVEYYLQNKSKPEFYRDPLSRNGYCNGQQVFEYVHRVLDIYNNYKHINSKIKK